MKDETNIAMDLDVSSKHGAAQQPFVSFSSFLIWVVRLSRLALVALFLFTAMAKLVIIKAFAKNVGELLSASGIDYQRWSWPVTIAVIVTEIVIALLLLMPRTVRVGALAAAALLAAFAGYALYYVYVLNGEPLECGCFGGIIASQLGVKTALRNLALLVPAMIVWFGYRWSKDRSGNDLAGSGSNLENG